MIEALRARLAAWLRSRVDSLSLFALVAETGMGMTLALGFVQAVRGLSSPPMLLYVGAAVVTVRILAVWDVKKGARLLVLLLSGVNLVTLNTAKVLSPFLALVWRLATATRLRIWGGSLTADPAFARLLPEIGQGTAAFSGSMTLWVRSLMAGRPLQMEMATLLIWGLAVFALTAWAGWFLHLRQKPFLAVLPVVFALGFTVETVNTTYYYFGVLAAFAVMAVLVFSHASRERAWERAGYGYSEDLRLDIGWMTAAACAVVFIAAAFSPNVSLKTFLERIEAARQPEPEPVEIAPALGLVEQAPEPDWPASAGSLPSSRLISSPPELLDTQMFQAWVTSLRTGGTRFNPYWREATYEVYTGHGWLAGNAVPEEYAPDERILLQAPEGQPTVEFRIRVQSDNLAGTLIHTGELISVSQPVQVLWRETPPGWQDLASGRLDALEYSVRATWPAPGLERLNVAGEDYPDWISDRYLALPDGIPQRVLDLAAEFAAEYPHPYARSEAIEAYLRQFPYNLEVPFPPLNRDIVDYFLFDLQEGYCDYYATAMVVLARLAGLPARVVGGYAPVVPDPESGLYQVTAAEAHTWVEVYFVGIGWIEFEPTASQALIERTAAEIQEPAPTAEITPQPGALVLPQLDQPWKWGILLAVAAIAALFAWDRISISTRSYTDLLLLLRDRVYQLARQSGVTRPQFATLNEIVAGVRDAVSPAFSAALLEPAARRAFSDVEHAADLLSDAAYRGRGEQNLSRRSLVRCILQSRRAAVRLWLLERFS